MLLKKIQKFFFGKSSSDKKSKYSKQGLKKVGFLISGRGSNLIAILNKVRQRKLLVDPVLVISNRKSAQGLEKARSYGVDAIFINPKDFKNIHEYEACLVHKFKEKGAELIVCAGYMKILHKNMLKAFPSRIVNIHPSLLPAFPGLNAQEQALSSGAKVSGCTVHFVDEGMDTGPIIMQSKVAIKKTDSLVDVTKNILRLEHDTYWRAIKSILK